jgi:hypothetical protein
MMTALFILVLLLLAASLFYNFVLRCAVVDLARKLQAEQRARLLDKVAMFAAVFVPLIMNRFFNSED